MGDLGVIMVHIKSDSKKWPQITANVSQLHTAEKIVLNGYCDVNWVKYSDSVPSNSIIVN